MVAAKYVSTRKYPFVASLDLACTQKSAFFMLLLVFTYTYYCDFGTRQYFYPCLSTRKSNHFSSGRLVTTSREMKQIDGTLLGFTLLRLKGYKAENTRYRRSMI